MPNPGIPTCRIFTIIATMSILANVAVAEDTPASLPLCPAMQEVGTACQHDMLRGDHHGGAAGLNLFERMGTELQLSDTQKQELGALLEIYRPRIKELAERGQTSGQAMFQLAPDDPAYNTRAAELSQLAGTTAAEMVTLLTELQATAYGLLTQEQKAKFMELRAEQHKRMETMRTRMKERRLRGDWQPGMHSMHGQDGPQCMPAPAPGDAVTTPSASE